jgi:hypothetical protein
VLDTLRATPEPLPRAALRARLRINNQRLGDLLLALERAELVRRTPAGWAVTSPTPPRHAELQGDLFPHTGAD